MTAPCSRRGLLKGLALLTAGGGTALAAAAAAAEPHPDAEILTLAGKLKVAEVELDAAEQAARRANAAARRAIAPCPAALYADADDKAALRSSAVFVGVEWGGLCPVMRPGDRVGCPSQRWSGKGLRRAIKVAPLALGTGGRTPFRIRRWKSLLSCADAYDPHIAEMNDRFKTKDRHKDEKSARDRRNKIRAAIKAQTAKTIEGLRVQVELFDGFYLQSMDAGWKGLLLSAAAVTGASAIFRERDE